MAEDTIITTAMKRFRLAEDATDDLRQDSLDDFKFSVGDQWPDNVKNDRNSQKRPCLTVDQTGPFIRQITNDQRQNRPSLKITAVDDQTEETAEVLEGIVRHIQADSDADIAYDTACDCQVRIGFGYFRVITDYEDETSFDQDIKIKAIKNPFTVYFDPAAVEPDYSDAKWCFVVEDILKEDFEGQYPDASSDFALSSTGDNAEGWKQGDFIRVAEYWTVEEKTKTIYLISNGQQKTTIDDVRLMPVGWSVVKQRQTTEKVVKCRKITAHEVLSTDEWAGKYIPIIPVLGEDYDIDGTRVLKGLVRSMKDPQRMSNYWLTSATEQIALAPKSPWVIALGQMKGFESIWETANVGNYSHLPYNPVANAPVPTRNVAEPPIQAMTSMIALSGNQLSQVTGMYKNNLGDQSGGQSGKSIVALQKEGDTATYHFQDNLARAIKHLGRILLDLIPKIYDTPRIMRMLHEDGSSETVKINQPTGTMNQFGQPTMFDLKSAAKYDVAVNVGPSYTTKRQENQDFVMQLVQTDPQIMAQAGDLIVKQFDIPMADALAERIKMFLPQPVQQQLQDKDQQIPPQARQQMDQMSQMIQALTQQVHQLSDERDQKQVEISSKERIAAANNATNIITAGISAHSDINQAFVDHELGMIEQKADVAGQAALSEQQHDQQMMQTQQQAALQPPPQQPQPQQGQNG